MTRFEFGCRVEDQKIEGLRQFVLDTWMGLTAKSEFTRHCPECGRTHFLPGMDEVFMYMGGRRTAVSYGSPSLRRRLQ
jgi:hypothetical protein